MKSILVIGGTGTVGRQVVARLVSRAARVRVMARNPGAAGFPAQVEVVQGDLTVPETLDGCLDGIETVFLVWTAQGSAVRSALERITKDARWVVFLSAPLKTAHPMFQQPNGLRTMVEGIEKLIESSGVQWTFVRPGMFAANALSWWAPQIRRGDVVRWPYLSVPTAPIDERDIAAVAVRALCEEGHGGAEYVLTGPQSLSQREQVSAIGRVLGRSLRIEEVTPEQARRELVSSAMPLVALNMLMDAWAAALGQAAHVTSTVAEITGASAKTFEQWASDNAAEFRA
jgi:uncharacterized protein YbjT (DUF2867 family)